MVTAKATGSAAVDDLGGAGGLWEEGEGAGGNVAARALRIGAWAGGVVVTGRHREKQWNATVGRP
jgi:hypothetical protein